MGQRWLDGYSAAVEIYLLVDGTRYDVAQIGAGSLILRGPAQIAAQTMATLVMVVDGEEERQQIVLCSNVQDEEPVTYF